MFKNIIILFLFPLLLIAAERKRQIDLVPPAAMECNPSFADSPYLSTIHKALQSKNIKLHITDLKKEKDTPDLTYVVIWNFPPYLEKGTLKKFPKKKLLLFAWEPRSIQKHLYSSKYLDQFKRVYTWNDDLVDNKKFFKFYYPAYKPMMAHRPSFEEKKLATQISSSRTSTHARQLYGEREKVIQFFEDKSDFEFYGPGWKDYKNYRGVIENKLEVLKNYRFSFCYENIHDVKGYISEKIFDCFAAGVVPIYWGASNVTDYIPKNCFIDRRDFETMDQLYAFLQTMDEATYESYIQNIQAFLDSDQAKLFSQEMFNTIFLEAIRFP